MKHATATATQATSQMVLLDHGKPVFASIIYREVVRETMRLFARTGYVRIRFEGRTVAVVRYNDLKGNFDPDQGSRLALVVTTWAPPRLVEALQRRLHVRPKVD